MPNRFERRLGLLDETIKTSLISIDNNNVNTNTHVNRNINSMLTNNNVVNIRNINNNLITSRNENINNNVNELSNISFDTNILDFRLRIQKIEKDIDTLNNLMTKSNTLNKNLLSITVDNIVIDIINIKSTLKKNLNINNKNEFNRKNILFNVNKSIRDIELNFKTINDNFNNCVKKEEYNKKINEITLELKDKENNISKLLKLCDTLKDKIKDLDNENNNNESIINNMKDSIQNNKENANKNKDDLINIGDNINKRVNERLMFLDNLKDLTKDDIVVILDTNNNINSLKRDINKINSSLIVLRNEFRHFKKNVLIKIENK